MELKGCCRGCCSGWLSSCCWRLGAEGGESGCWRHAVKWGGRLPLGADGVGGRMVAADYGGIRVWVTNGWRAFSGDGDPCESGIFQIEPGGSGRLWIWRRLELEEEGPARRRRISHTGRPNPTHTGEDEECGGEEEGVESRPLGSWQPKLHNPTTKATLFGQLS
uniref:Uncharacterized protein n=1 Tax=Arundo donax TaxID=35708 RepID=A0A0A8Z8S7_ARUDO